MPSNATELMRMMVIRSPQPRPGQPAILLAPSDEIMRAPAPFQKAREFLGKKMAEPSRRIVDPAAVPNAPKLAALGARALDSASDGQAPGALVEGIFGKPAGQLIAPAVWSAALRRLSDSILFYKLAYREGPRPLAELADLYRVMVAVGRVAEGTVADMTGLRAALEAPLRLPPPFARVDAKPELKRMEARREKAVEIALDRVRKATELHEEERRIQNAIDELVELPIDAGNFTVVDRASLGGAGKPRARSAPVEQRAPPDGSDEQILAANWAVRREALTRHGAVPASDSSAMRLALTSAGVRALSADTRKVVAGAGVDPAADAVERVTAVLAGKREAVRAEREALLATNMRMESRTLGGVEVARMVRNRGGSGHAPIALPANAMVPADIAADWDDLVVDSGWPGDPPGPQSSPEVDSGPSLLLPAGVGQLYVIRQQITGYRSGEISHVENVLPGETRERTHRRLRQQEVTTTEEHEREQEDEKSLQTTNRSELEREVQATVKRQFNAGASAQVSGSYGTVEFAAAGQVQAATASESASKTAQRIASEVIETSRQRVTERVRTERTQKTLEELEETNVHKFSGATLSEPLVGVYQWIDKIYRNEIWSYGTRTMYEAIVPEPGSALIAAALTPGAADPSLVDKPPPLTVPVEQLDPKNVHALCVAYGVTEEIEPYPEPALVNIAFTRSADASAENNFYAETKEVEVPDGYQPVDGWIVVKARGENHPPRIGVTIGRAAGGFHFDNLVINTTLPHYFTCASWPDTANVEKLQAAIAVDDYSSFAVSVMIQVRPSAARIDKWKRAAFAAIRGAYDARLGEWRDYQSQVDFEKPELSEKLLASNPSASRLLARHELQRAAMEIFRNLSMDFDLISEGNSAHAMPRIDFPGLAEASPEILFLSQAFEWPNMTWVLYPYFFGRRPEWSLKMLLAGVDSDFVEFLKSGAARVQVPVRPGWEAAVDHYMMTREPFFGQGMPQIGDDLYLPYVEEAREAGGAALGGEHVAALDFETTVPTTLVVARNGEKIDVAGGTLPRWQKTGELWEEA
jgi:hypothetical protein